VFQLSIISQCVDVDGADCRIIHLARMPYSLDGLGQTDIIRLEFIEADANDDSSEVQEPAKNLPHGRMLPCWDVVDDKCLEADVRVNQECSD